MPSASPRWPLYHPPTDAYNLVNLYVGYKPTEDVPALFAIDNLLDQFYPLSARGSPGVKFAGPGITYKGALKIRFGVM